MALFGKKEPKPPNKPDPRDREKRAGAREYEARRQDRLAERLEGEGDVEGARTAREAAEEERRPPKRGR
jgi:hypothetical protein